MASQGRQPSFGATTLNGKGPNATARKGLLGSDDRVMVRISHNQLQLDDLEATEALAQLVAECCRGGEFLALDGDLGSGKTSFTRALTRALGCARLANSPTYSLFQRYRGGRLEVLHGDFYRLGSSRELGDLGWEEMIEEMRQGLLVIEWAGRFPDALPSDRIHLTWSLSDTGIDEQRSVTVSGSGEAVDRVRERLFFEEQTS